MIDDIEATEIEQIETEENVVGEEAESIQSDTYEIVERGLDGWPADTILVKTSEPKTVEIAVLFGDEEGEGGEAVTHEFEYFVVSSIEDVIEGQQAEFANMLHGMPLDDDSEEPRITLNESAVFCSNAEGAEGGPQVVKVDGGDLAEALEELTTRLEE